MWMARNDEGRMDTLVMKRLREWRRETAQPKGCC